MSERRRDERDLRNEEGPGQYPEMPPPREPSYAGYDVESAPQSRGDSLIARLIPIVIPIVVAYFLIQFFGVAKSQYQADITRLEMDLVGMREDDTSLQEQINLLGSPDFDTSALEASINASIDEVKSQVTEAQNDASRARELVQTEATRISNISSYIGSFPSVDEMNALTGGLDNLDSLRAIVENLEDRTEIMNDAITAIEETVALISMEEEEGTPSEENVSAEVTTFGGMGINFQGIKPDTVSSATLRIKVTNESAVRVENVQLVLFLYSNYDLPVFASGYPTLDGNPQWQLLSQQSRMLGYATGWGFAAGIDLDAGQSRTMYPQISLQAAGPGEWETTNYFFTPSVNVETWD